jgi:hypothetical protein
VRKRKAGEAKGEVGGSPARGCIHGGRPLQTGRRVCSPKIMPLRGTNTCFDLANAVALSAMVARKLRLPHPDVLWPPPEQARDERYDEQHQEYEKQYFCDLRGACGDAPESEHRGDQRNDKKYQRIVEHL